MQDLGSNTHPTLCLATQISFANEIANLCHTLGNIDVAEVMEGVHLSHYLQPFLPESSTRVRAPIASFLEAGCGFGGSCLPKDVKALVEHGKSAGTSMRVLSSVLETNRLQPGRMIALLKGHYPDLSGVHVSVLGLAFKPDTDDMRESPAIPIVSELATQGAVVRGYDPVARDTAREAMAGMDIVVVDSLGEALERADALLLVTRWEEFQALPEIVARLDPQPLVVDGRRVLDPDQFKRYERIGLRRR